MARKLSIRKRGRAYQIGPAGHRAPTATVVASGKREALRRAKVQMRDDGTFDAAARGSCRSYARKGVRGGVEVPVVMNTALA